MQQDQQHPPAAGDDRIREIRDRLDELRRAFAHAALEVMRDEPTRHFAAGSLDAFERLDEHLRRLDFARRHAEPS